MYILHIETRLLGPGVTLSLSKRVALAKGGGAQGTRRQRNRRDCGEGGARAVWDMGPPGNVVPSAGQTTSSPGRGAARHAVSDVSVTNPPPNPSRAFQLTAKRENFYCLGAGLVMRPRCLLPVGVTWMERSVGSC